MELTFDSEYNQRLFVARRVTFHDALQSISDGNIQAHFPYPDADQLGTAERQVVVVSIAGRAYFVPYLLSAKEWVLETVYPCERPPVNDEVKQESADPMTYLNVEEQTIIERLRRVNLKSLPQESPRELARMKRAARRLVRREKKGSPQVSAHSVRQTHEHAGKLGSQTGVMKQW